MRFRTSLHVGIFLVVGVLVLAGTSLSTATTQEKPIYKPTGGEATIVGTISFFGTPPEPTRIDMSADPICYTVNSDPITEWVVVNNHKLANVVVYVRGESLSSYLFDTPSSEVTLEHRGCRYVPHVFGIQTNQTLKILNTDPTTQNTHAMPKNNPDWNQSQTEGAPPLQLRFASPELFVPMKCNQHPWEKAYVGVFSHPFFSVSGTDGSYKISGLPPGQYTVVAWHEKLGEQTVDLFLAGSEQRSLDFAFKASDH
jgi:hypothetical protein